MRKFKEVEPEVSIIKNIDSIDLVALVTKFCHSGVEASNRKIGKPFDIILGELKKKHYSILEYETIMFQVSNISNIDLLYLSSFTKMSIMKQSFRQSEHCNICLNGNLKSSVGYNYISNYFDCLYALANSKKKNGWESVHENNLPLCSTANCVAKTNLRELNHIIKTKEKFPTTLKKIVENVCSKINPNLLRLYNEPSLPQDKFYILDRMLTQEYPKERRTGLVHDNYTQDVPITNKYFIVHTTISFKQLSQLIRERGLGITLKLSAPSLKYATQNVFRKLEAGIDSKEFEKIFSSLEETISLKDSLSILPFATMVDSMITIPLEKLYEGFNNKIYAKSSSLNSFSKYVISCILKKYPALEKEILGLQQWKSQ